VFVPIHPAIDYPLKAVETALKIGDEVIALQWLRDRPLGLSTFQPMAFRQSANA